MQKEEIVQEIIQKQFQIAGFKVLWKDIPEDGFIEVKKKKVLWYDFYKFSNIEEYEQWRKWGEEKLSIIYKEDKVRSEMNYIDFKYGMNYNYEKKRKGSQSALF